MEIIFRFTYENVPPEWIEDSSYLLNTVVLNEDPKQGPPSLLLYFSMQSDQLHYFADRLRTAVDCSNDSGEDPYDATVGLKKTTEGQCIIFQGNLLRVLDHLQDVVIGDEHVNTIKSHQDAGEILERSKKWGVGFGGRLVANQPSKSESIFFHAAKRKRDAEDDALGKQEFNYTISCP